MCVLEVSGFDYCDEAARGLASHASMRDGLSVVIYEKCLQDDTDDSTREETEEAKTIFTRVESVIDNKDEWKSLKLVQDQWMNSATW